MIQKNGKKITTSVRDVKRGDKMVVAGGSLATV
jgi:preprotein translocase subunit YajC